LANDPRVQAVYIATPASAHKDNILLCLNAGKAVLCEKPFTLNGKEAGEVIALARQRRIFLMEAMWTRFVPAMVKVRELLAAGAIGEVRHFTADLGTRTDFDPQGRLFNADLGGGALLQKGCYLLSLSCMIFGNPRLVRAVAVMSETGVDEHAGILLGHSTSQLASLLCSASVQTQRGATIVGTKGQIRIHEPVTCPASITLRQYRNESWHHEPLQMGYIAQIKRALIRYGKRSRLIRALRERCPNSSDRLLRGIRSKKIYAPPVGEGLHYQVSEVIKCLRAGQTESDIMPLNDSQSVMNTLDQIREQCDLQIRQD
jgi:predicted dehydrogenase